MSLDGLSLLLLLRLPELFVVRTQIRLFHQQQQPHLLSSMSFRSPKLFRIIYLMNDKKLMNLGRLGLLLPLLSPESVFSRYLIFETFSFHQ